MWDPRCWYSTSSGSINNRASMVPLEQRDPIFDLHDIADDAAMASRLSARHAGGDSSFRSIRIRGKIAMSGESTSYPLRNCAPFSALGNDLRAAVTDSGGGHPHALLRARARGG